MIARLWRWFVGSGNPPSWQEQIRVLEPEKKLPLPAVRGLRAEKEAKPFLDVRPSKVSPFEKRKVS